MKKYLDGLLDAVKRTGGKSTHAIKSFLMRQGLGDGDIGYANGIKKELRHFKNVEFMWDAVAKRENALYPGEDQDLAFVAEYENQIDVNKIIDDANKLPIVRADIRLMFFRANDPEQRTYFLERLRGLFERHRKSEPGDIYLLAGMEMQTLTYALRKLTIQRTGANVNPWEEY